MATVLKHVWELEEALGFLRIVQDTIRPHGYHLSLGGGVLNRGYSDKDLDIYFHPMCGNRDGQAEKLLDLLENTLGRGEPLGNPENYPEDSTYAYKIKFNNGGKRIDAFILES